MAEALVKYEDFSRIRNQLAEDAYSKMNISSNARMVTDKVYNKSLEDGAIESFEQRVAAISIDVASADMKYFPKDMLYGEALGHVEKRAYENLELMVSNKFRANTPTNINMGRFRQTYDTDGEFSGYEMKEQMGSACFVIPVEDYFGKSVDDLGDGILGAWVAQQQLHKSGGGTGFSFCALRPKGSAIGYNPAVDGMNSIDWSSIRGVSSGYDSFLNHFFNEATDAVKQGNSRRGANMGIQRIDHMDFLDHLYAKVGTGKENEYKIRNFNLSLAMTDEFMEAAVNNQTYTLFNPHRAEENIKHVLEKKFGVENPELVRRADLATRDQFEAIMKKNIASPLSPQTIPNMYLDEDSKTVINAYTGKDIGFVVNDIVNIEAKKILDEFSRLSYSNGEPGMVFIDRMNEFHPTLYYNEIEATNPCGEQPLPANGACNLGSINAGKFVKYEVFNNEKKAKASLNNTGEFSKYEKRRDGKFGVMSFDWKSLDTTIGSGIRFLDNVIDRSDFPSEKITKAVSDSRNIGLGYMGVADAMVLMKMRYGSDESLEFADALAERLYKKSLEASEKLAEERGAFPLFEGSFYNTESEHAEWFNSKPEDIRDRFRGSRSLSSLVDREHKMIASGTPIRNACRTTQAPTGTIRRSTGQIFDEDDNLAITSGIEPMYAIVEHSNILNTSIKDTYLAPAKLLKREGLDVNEIMDAVDKNRGSAFIYDYTTSEVVDVLQKIPEDVRNVLVTAAGGEGDLYEIKPEEHVKMMATFQKWNDSAISKTINLPESSNVEDMADKWVDLWKRGTKGGTVYRDQSRSFQILNIATGESKVAESNGKFERTLMQPSITLEMPYIDYRMSNGNIGVEPDPSRCFTTLTYDPVRESITGVFQSVADVNPETISSNNSRNIELSRSFKNGRSLDAIIHDLEKVKITGSQSGVLVDKGVMSIQGANDFMRHQVKGGTSTEALLSTLYVTKFLTGGGKNFDSQFIEDRKTAYITGAVTLRSIINSRGDLDIGEEKNRPSIFSGKKVVKLGENVPEHLCPECM